MFKNTLFVFLVLFAVVSFAIDRFKTIHIADFENLLGQDKTVAVFDANDESTRSHVGLIHGAHALSTYDKYAESELPADKKTPLVFYCANKMCSSSHDAAERAVGMGYTNVSVMVDGVYGWQKARKPLDTYIADNAKEIQPLEVKKLIDANKVTVLDVREDEERHEVVPTAQWLPLSTDATPAWNASVKKLDKSKSIVVYCASGKRAKKVAEELARQGYRTSYFKGPDQWKSAGLKLDPGPTSSSKN